METSYDEFETSRPARPQFLKILCILTFICSSYLILSSTYVYFRAEKTSEIIESSKTEITEKQNKKSPEEQSFLKKVMSGMSEISTPENLRKKAIGDIIASALCLLGAFLMWNLNRVGFYIYTLGTIIGIFAPFYLFGNNFLTLIGAGFTSFIGLLFVIFYAMNLKSMK